MNLSPDTILAFAAIVGLLVTAASVVGSFRISRNTSTVSAYRESAQAWESKSKAQESEIHDLQTQLATANAQIESLNQRVAMLQDMVTSRTLIEGLSRSVESSFLTLTRQMSELQALSGEIKKHVTATQAGDSG